MAIHGKRNAPKTDAGPCSEEHGNTRVDRMRDETASAPQCAAVRRRTSAAARTEAARLQATLAKTWFSSVSSQLIPQPTRTYRCK